VLSVGVLELDTNGYLGKRNKYLCGLDMFLGYRHCPNPYIFLYVQPTPYIGTEMTQHKSLVHVLEDVVLALEEQGQTEQDIFSLVNMILRGFIRSGEITEEYKQLAQLAIQQRESMSRTIDTPPKFDSGIITSSKGFKI